MQRKIPTQVILLALLGVLYFGFTSQTQAANYTNFYAGGNFSAAGSWNGPQPPVGGGTDVTLVLTNQGGNFTLDWAGAFMLNQMTNVLYSGNANLYASAVTPAPYYLFTNTAAGVLPTINCPGDAIQFNLPVVLAANLTINASQLFNGHVIFQTTAAIISDTTPCSVTIHTVDSPPSYVGSYVDFRGANTYRGATIISAGVLKLNHSGSYVGSVNNSTNISIAAGATLDVSPATSYTYLLSTNNVLTASGTATAAKIQCAPGGGFNCGAQPIVLNYDGSHPALAITNSAAGVTTLTLSNNTFTVNGSVLANGDYSIITNYSGSISVLGSSFTVNGTAIGTGKVGTLSVITAGSTSYLDLHIAAASAPIGPVSAANSTVTATPNVLIADNVSLSTVTVTLRDATNNLVNAGTNVTWSVTGSGNTVIPAASGVTIAGGTCTFTVQSSVVGTKLVTVTGGGTTITTSLPITFTGPASATNSTVTVSPASLPANNTAASTVTVTLADSNNVALGSGIPVTWTVSGSGNTVSPAASGITSVGGICMFTVRSSVAEVKTVVVNTGTISFTNSISFYTPPITLSWDPLLTHTNSIGSGVWDTNSLTGASWGNGSGDVAWPNNGDTALFGIGVNAGPDYFTNLVITLNTPIKVGPMTFNSFNGASEAVYQIAGTNSLTVVGTPTIAVTSDAMISSPLAGTGFTKTGAGNLILNGTNTTYGGGITLNGGSVEVDANGALGTGLFTYSGGNNLLTNAVSSTLTNPIFMSGGNGETFKVGVQAGSTLALGGAITNANPAGGSITNNMDVTGGGTLVVTNVAYCGNLYLDIGTAMVMGGNFTNCGFTTLSGALSVPGTYVHSANGSSPGMLINSGASLDVPVGGTYDSAPTAYISVNGALSVEGTMNFNGSSFYTAYPGSVSLAGVFNNNTTNEFRVAGNTTATVSGSYNSPNAGLNVNGAGTLNFSGTTTNLTYLEMNNYSIINISGTMVCGILEAYGGGAVQLSDGTTAGSAQFKNISYAAAGGITGGSASMSTLIISNISNINLGSTFTIGDGNVNTVDAANNINFFKTGSGNLYISNSVTSYTGDTTVSGGILELAYPTLATNSTVTVASGAVLQLDFPDTNIVTSLVLNGVGATAGVHNNASDPSYITGTGSLLVLTGAAAINPNPTNIVFSVSGSTLNLSWPADYLGWYMQSNSVALANTNYWFDVPNSQTVTNLAITVNTSSTNVFFRMRKP
jgi:autotransporter-associated beta strand protein